MMEVRGTQTDPEDFEDNLKADSNDEQVNAQQQVDRISQDGAKSDETAQDSVAIAGAEDVTINQSPEQSGANSNDHLKEPPYLKVSTRKGSRVSFSEDQANKLYEIDLEKGDPSEGTKKPPVEKGSLRYFIMLLALFCPLVTTYSRTIINNAITDMIDPSFARAQSKTNTAGNLTSETNEVIERRYWLTDNSCLVSEAVERRLLEELDDGDSNNNGTNQNGTNNGRASHHHERFKWDSVKQGLLKGAYAIGHAPFQVPGSRVSEIYGSHRVITMSAFLIAISCLLAPYFASLHFYILFSDLVLLGVLGSVMTPALMTLFSNWLTPSEKSVMVSTMLIGSRLGFALSAFLCGLVAANFSWRWIFFSAGWASLIFSFMFFVFVRSRPKDHWLISQEELNYLASKNTLVRESLSEGNKQQHELNVVDSKDAKQSGAEANRKPKEAEKGKERKKKSSAPWLAILTNIPVWAFVLTKFCVKLAGDTVQIELPTYLIRVLHFSAQDNGNIVAWNYVIFCAGCSIVGTLAPAAIKRRPFNLSKTVIRKCFQCFASFSVGFLLLGIAYSVCDDITTLILLMLLFFVTTFSTGGEAQIPLDLTERYPGTIHAIASSLALSGAIEPTVVGFFIRNSPANRESWKYVWMGASAISFLGGLIFLFFGDASIQPFDKIKSKDNEERDSVAADANGKEEKLNHADNKAFESDNIDNRAGENNQGFVEIAAYKESVQI